MERFKILKIEKHEKEKYFSLRINDKKENISFWVDCSITIEDGCKYIDWEYNAYIVHLDDENDIRLKEYQDDWENNGDYLQSFIDNENDEILKMLGDFAND